MCIRDRSVTVGVYGNDHVSTRSASGVNWNYWGYTSVHEFSVGDRTGRKTPGIAAEALTTWPASPFVKDLLVTEAQAVSKTTPTSADARRTRCASVQASRMAH